jgi:hypothetical protein
MAETIKLRYPVVRRQNYLPRYRTNVLFSEGKISTPYSFKTYLLTNKIVYYPLFLSSTNTPHPPPPYHHKKHHKVEGIATKNFRKSYLENQCLKTSIMNIE